MKRLTALAWIAALCLGLLVYSLLDVPKEAEPVSSGSPQLQQTLEAAETGLSVYVQDLQARAAWAAAAGSYSTLTDCEVTLSDTPEAAQLMVFTDLSQARSWADRCVDLSATVAYAQLVNWDLAAQRDGTVYGLPLEMEGHGLICNTHLLAGHYAVSEIQDFSKLEEVVDELSRSAVKPFASADPAVLARLLLSLPEGGRALADLFLDNGGTFSTTGVQELVRSQAVFCFGSTAELTEDISLDILPLCLDHADVQDQTLCVTGRQYLCIRGDVSGEQTAAAMALLDLLVLPQEDGTTPLDLLGRLSPYRQTTFTSNAPEQSLREDLAAGKGCLVLIEQAPEGAKEALLAYQQDRTDENWAKFLAFRRSSQTT